MSHGGTQLRQRQVLLKNVLRDFGYQDAHVSFDWKVSNHDELRRWGQDDDAESFPGGSPTQLDVVAFHDDREKNWHTTALVAELDRIDLVQDKDNGRNRARNVFDLTASPCALFAGNGSADLWLKCWEQQPKLVRDIPFEKAALRREFCHNRRELDRESLARLRGGQRYLFDSVYDARREELVQFLHRGLSKATWLAPELARSPKNDTARQKKEREQRQALSRVAIGLMAARILEDKGFFKTTTQTLDAREILHNAESRANGFFQQVISQDLARLETQLGRQVLDRMLPCLMAHLTGPASFSMVTPDALHFFWETALTAERRRGNDLELNGIHYTPRSIAQHILDRIPLEELPPCERYVLDMASGSGSFLLSATERLRQIFDAREEGSEADVVEHLRKHVIGNDTDPIAEVVTRLLYLLEHWTKTSEHRNVPAPSRLENRNALLLTQADFVDTPPRVLVGNPPFGATEGGQQLANRFLSKSLDLLLSGGYLGIIMPGPFLKQRRDRSQPARERLLRECELLEVWEQPLQTVGLSARQETCVIVARKHGNQPVRRNATLFKSTYSSKGPAVRALREHLRSTFTFAATGLPGNPEEYWLQDVMHRIIAGPVDKIWCKIDTHAKVEDLCETGLGIKAILATAKFSCTPQRGFRPYLRRQSSIRPYFLLQDHWKREPEPSQPYIDPDSARWPKPALWPLFERPKVVLTNNTNRNSSCQLRAAFDEYGVFPDGDIASLALRKPADARDSWARGLLRDHDERSILLWLVAILNSPVGNAWVASMAPPRAIPQEVRTSLPLPTAFDSRIPELVERTLDAPRSSESGFEVWQPLGRGEAAAADASFEELAGEINTVVLKSYRLSAKDGRLLCKYLEGMTDPWVDAPEDAHLARRGVTYRRITGTVVSVDVKRQKVTLDLPRYRRKARGPVKVPLPKHMPGWALREGAEFTCLAPANRRDPDDLKDPWLLREFRPLPYAYLEPSEIERMAGFRALETTP